jgi:hypothetical protein
MNKMLSAFLTAGFVTMILIGGIVAFFVATRLQAEVMLAGRVILLAIAGGTLTAVAVGLLWLWGWLATGNQARAARVEQERAAARQAHAEAARIERDSMVWTEAHPAGHQVYRHELRPGTHSTPLHLSPGPINGAPADVTPDEAARWQLHALAYSSGRGRGDIPNVHPLVEAGPRPLLEILRPAERVLIIGPSKAGKTTLLHWLIEERRQTSDVITIDPHGEPPKWGDVAAIGAGREYDRIEQTLNSLLFEMDRRYSRRAVGDLDFNPLTIIIDEWKSIVKNLAVAGGMLGTLLTEARKAQMFLIVGSHSDRVKALGIEGEGDLRAGFTVVRLNYDQGTGQRRAVIDDTEYQLPGPYDRPKRTPDPASIALPPPMTAEEKRIVELIMAGLTKYQICKEIWDGRRGRNYETIDQAAAKFGLQVA